MRKLLDAVAAIDGEVAGQLDRALEFDCAKPADKPDDGDGGPATGPATAALMIVGVLDASTKGGRDGRSGQDDDR